MSSDKPLRCKFGMHSWYLDCGLVRSVVRCNYCPAVDDKRAAAALDAERKRVSAMPPHASWLDVLTAAHLEVSDV